MSRVGVLAPESPPLTVVSVACVFVDIVRVGMTVPADAAEWYDGTGFRRTPAEGIRCIASADSGEVGERGECGEDGVGRESGRADVPYGLTM